MKSAKFLVIYLIIFEAFKIDIDILEDKSNQKVSDVLNTDFGDSLMETSTILTEGDNKKTINSIPKSSLKKSIRNAGRNRHFQNSPTKVKDYLCENYLSSAKKGDRDLFLDSLNM